MRSLVSSTSPNLVIYPSGEDIYKLNTSTREREVVTNLKFTPRCLIASNGWICCGGDHGRYAAIRMKAWDPHTSLAQGPDARLDLSSVQSSSAQRSESSSPLPRETSPQPQVKISKFGEEIVNCITLWFPRTGLHESVYKRPVAVLSNNDFTVTIVDLQDSTTLDTITLDDCVNRALLSPDGSILIAIGDDPYLHIYRRQESWTGPNNWPESDETTAFEWKRCDRVQLRGQHESQRKDDMRGSFAACFSPSGRYLAVGTQYGFISVFDAQYLSCSDIDPLIVTFPSSRPDTKKGAIRNIIFSPEPYDLLVWTEDGGRFGVADMRLNFKSRQIVELSSHAESVQRVIINERPGDFRVNLDTRLRNFRAAAGISRPESEQGRSQTTTNQPQTERFHIPLLPEETQVLEALQVQRRRRERETLSEEIAADVSGISHLSGWMALDEDERRNALEHRAISTSSDLPTTLRDIVANRNNESLAAFIAGRNQENQDRERRGHQPRRRGSVILAQTQRVIDRDSHEYNRNVVSTSTNPPRLPPIGSNPWDEVEALSNITGEPSSTRPVDATARMRIEMDNDRRQEYTRLIEQHWRDTDERNSIRLGAGYDSGFVSRNLRDATQTTGCAFGQDGQTL